VQIGFLPLQVEELDEHGRSVGFNKTSGEEPLQVSIRFKVGMVKIHLALSVPIHAAEAKECHLHLGRLAGYSAHHPRRRAELKPRNRLHG